MSYINNIIKGISDYAKYWSHTLSIGQTVSVNGVLKNGDRFITRPDVEYRGKLKKPQFFGNYVLENPEMVVNDIPQCIHPGKVKVSVENINSRNMKRISSY